MERPRIDLTLLRRTLSARRLPPIPTTSPGRRIVVLGTSGAGKSTVSRRLSARLDLPHIELDAEFWLPEWTPRPRPEMRRRVVGKLEANTEGWVVDGNYSWLRDDIWARADTLVWLDYSLARVMMQIVRRTARRVLRGETLWETNRETLRMAFSRDSIVLWALTTWARRRLDLDRAIRDIRRRRGPNIEVVQLRTPAAMRRWLDTVASAR